ncbi:MAG TPA: MEDS domain-containing protein [Thermoleophilaceae bacterium]
MPVLECSRCNELYYSAHGSTTLSCDACGGGVWRVFDDEVSFARVAALDRRAQPGDHAVLVYAQEGPAADFCADYLRDGMAHGERLVLAIPEALRDAVLERLGSAAVGDALVLDSREIYRPGFNPEATAAEYADLARSSGAVRLLCGPDGEAAAEIDAADLERYERIAHQLVIELNATALCVYDGQRLPIGFSPVAVHTHPLISRDGDKLRRNPDFVYEVT